MTHELKILPPYFYDVARGAKKFELRYNDRNYQEGDTLILKEYQPVDRQYTGDYVEVEVTHILYSKENECKNLDTFCDSKDPQPLNGLRKDWCIMSIEPIGGDLK